MAAITSISLAIDSSSVSLDNVLINEVETFNRDQSRRMTFTRDCVLPEDDTWLHKTIELAINGSIVFTGTVANREAVFSDDMGISYAYTAQGIEAKGDDWPVVSPFDGTTTVTFNQATTDPGYDPTYDGMSLGEMIKAVLEEPTTRDYLTSHKIGRYDTDGAIDEQTIADLEADFLGEYRPAKPVTFQGDNLFQAIRGVLQAGAPNYRMWFKYTNEPPPYDPTGPAVESTVIRFSDIRETAATKTIDLSKNPAPRLRRDTTNSFTRVIVRGGPDIRPMILDMDDGDLTENFAMPPWLATNDDAKDAWNIGVWYNADQKQIKGTCLCRRPRTSGEMGLDPSDPLLTDANWLYVDPADNTLTWSEDDYNQSSDGLAGFLFVERSPVSDWQDMVNRKVIYNTALTAGGKSYLQLDDPLPFTDYAKFTMIPAIWPGALTWRRYSIERLTAEGKSVAKYVQAAFPTPIPWNNTDGTPLSFTSAAVATIYFTPEGATEQRFATCGLAVDRQNESIILDQPSVAFFGQPSSLETGGASVDGQPENIRVLLPVALSPLEAVAPDDDEEGDPVFEGTASTVDGVERTLYVGQTDWVAEADTGPMRLWARQLLDSVKDTVIEGQAIVYGFDPINEPGTVVEFDDPCYETSPYSQYTSQAYSCMIRFNHGGPIPYHTEYAISNRRDQFRGYDHTMHPIIASPIKPNKDVDFRAGSLISRPEGAAMGGNLRSIQEFARTKLDGMK